MLSLLPSPNLNAQSQLMSVVPKLLRPCLSALPFKVQQTLLLSVLHTVFQGAIDDGDFEFLQDKWLRISILDLALHWLLSFQDNQLVMSPMAQGIKENVSFSANGDDLLLIAGRKQDPDTLFFQRRLQIEGDTELGLEVKNLIDTIELEQLPTIVHKLVDVSANLIQQHRNRQVD